jgi:hypothetical protein
MLGFGIFFRKKREREKALAVLELLEFAASELHPDNYVTSDDLALKLRPELAALNLIIGTPEEYRHHPISYDALIQAYADYNEEGLSQKLSELLIARQDLVSGALIGAAQHEYELRRKGRRDNDVNLGYEVRETAQKALKYLNLGAKG